ncbi:MAG: methyltransferase domain-containing protein [Anaerolineales bacterium]
MPFQEKRAHGVTLALNRDYAARTVEQQGAFVLPYLRPSMSLLDMGCGPGTITLGLAQAVSPGCVTGIDHDPMHIEAARTLAAQFGITNVTFEIGGALSLPFENGTFDAVFENDLFTHLAQHASQAAGEAYRVLKPGGFLAVRDVDADSVVWGHFTESLKELDKLFMAWHQSRGSNITIGKLLPEILRKAGFTKTIKSVSADTKGDPESVRAHTEITLALLEGSFGRDIVRKGWADDSMIARLEDAIREWGEHPDAFFANVHVEVVGWKPT